MRDGSAPAPSRPNCACDESSSIPDVSSSLAELPSSAPDVTSSTPDVCASAPGGSTSVSEVSTSAPEAISSVPDVASSAREVVTSTPEVVSLTPEVVTSTPEVVTWTPEVVSSTPEEATSAREVDTSAIFLSLPTRTNRAPKATIHAVRAEKGVFMRDVERKLKADVVLCTRSDSHEHDQPQCEKFEGHDRHDRRHIGMAATTWRHSSCSARARMSRAT